MHSEGLIDLHFFFSQFAHYVCVCVCLWWLLGVGALRWQPTLVILPNPERGADTLGRAKLPLCVEVCQLASVSAPTGTPTPKRREGGLSQGTPWPSAFWGTLSLEEVWAGTHTHTRLRTHTLSERHYDGYSCLKSFSCTNKFLLHVVKLREHFFITFSAAPVWNSPECLESIHRHGRVKLWGRVEKTRRVGARSIPTMRHHKRNRQIQPRCSCHLAAWCSLMCAIIPFMSLIPGEKQTVQEDINFPPNRDIFKTYWLVPHVSVWLRLLVLVWLDSSFFFPPLRWVFHLFERWWY